MYQIENNRTMYNSHYSDVVLFFHNNNWIIRLSTADEENGVKDNPNYYCRLTLDEERNQFQLTKFTEFFFADDTKRYFAQELIVGDKIFRINRHEHVPKIHSFDMLTNQWKSVDNNLVLRAKEENEDVEIDDDLDIFANVENNLFAVFGRPQITCAMYDNDVNTWRPIINVNRPESKKTCSKFLFNAKGVFIHMEFLTPCFLRPIMGRLTGMVINIGGVLPLKDLCMMKLFNAYEDQTKTLTEKCILTDTIFSELPMKIPTVPVTLKNVNERCM